MFAAFRAATLSAVFTRRVFASPTRRSFARPLFFSACLALPAAVALKDSIALDVEPPSDVVLDPDTSIEFPKLLRVQSKANLPVYSLLGCGVRTVSFVGIKVYSVGFYADMTNPALKSLSKSAPQEEKIKFIVENTTCMLRIIPTRNTSYTHLRDAFLRTLTARMQTLYKDKSMSTEDALAIQSPINKLKTLFPNTTFAKHKPLDIILTPPEPTAQRTLIVRDLGAVTSDWVAKTIILSYFEGQGNSPAMKKAVWESLEGVGSD